MGKAKPAQPESSEKIIRKLGENLFIKVTEKEKKYRNKNGPDDVKHIRKEKLRCTVCGKSLADLVKKAADPFVHMVLEVLVCQDCSSFYGDGYFSVDEDGDDKYCRWCGQGGTLYLCSGCTCAFCKKCIKLNLEKQDLKDLESDDWKCLICQPEPLYECRTVCWFLQEHSVKMKNEKFEDEASTLSRARRDRSSRRSIKEENTPQSSRKRRASVVEEEPEIEKEKETKRRKSLDSRKESKQQSTPSNRKRRNQTPKEKKDEKESGDESPLKQSLSEPRSKRSRGLKAEDESIQTKRPSRTTKKKEQQSKISIEEVIISDSNEDKDDSENEVQKRGRSRNSSSSSIKTLRKDTNEGEDIKNNRPKRGLSKTLKISKLAKRLGKTLINPLRSGPKKPSKSSEKNMKSEKSEVVSNDTSTPKRQRQIKNHSPKDEENCESNVKSDSVLQLASFNGNSESESDSKTITSKIKSSTKLKKNVIKSKLTENIDIQVVQGSGYINSALKDIMELSIIISNRCEKLSSKSIQSHDDVIGVLTKIQQLMTGVHTNLELIEKGLNTKISNWQNVKSGDKETDHIIEKQLIINQVSSEKIPVEEETKYAEQIEDNVGIKNLKELQLAEKKENSQEIIEVDYEKKAELVDTVGNKEKEECNEHIENNNEESNKEEIISEKSDSEEKESDTEKEKNQAILKDNFEAESNKTGEIEEKIQKRENITDDKTLEFSEYKLKKDEDASEKNGEIEGKNMKREDVTTNKILEFGECKLKKDEDKEGSHISVSKESEADKSENSFETGEESQNDDKSHNVEGKNELEEENENINEERVVPISVSDSLNEFSCESVDSVAVVVSKSHSSELDDTDNSNKEGIVINTSSEEQTSDIKDEENVSTEKMDVDTGEDDESKIQEDPNLIVEENINICMSTASSQPNESGDLKNGTVDDKGHIDKSKETESVEQRSSEKREESRIVKTSNYESKSSGSPHSDSSRRLSGDRYHHEQQRWSADRGGNWNHDRNKDRGWTSRGRPWTPYNARRPNRGGWGWNR